MFSFVVFAAAASPSYFPPSAELLAGEAQYQRLQETDSSGTVKADGLLQGIAERKALMQQSRASTNSILAPIAGVTSASWTSLGPNNIGGRINAILSDSKAGRMFVGAPNGGIWVSVDGGSSWGPVDDFMGSLSVRSLALDPTTGYIYAGTGDSAGKIHGQGIFVSTDGGSTWNSLSSTDPAANSDFQFINDIAINSAGWMLVATDGGVYSSNDGGSSWTKVYTGKSNSVALDPNNTSNGLYETTSLAAAQGSGGASEVAYTTNGGANWTKVVVDSTNSSIPDGHSVLAYAPSQSGVVYASVAQNGGELYQSANGGQAWTKLAVPTEGTKDASQCASYSYAYLCGQGWYANTIWVDPTDAKHLIVGGLDLFQSTDGGASWTQISDWVYRPASPHADQHAIAADPGYNGTTDKKVFFGTDGGLYGATDVTTVSTTSGWTELNNGLGITQFYGGAGHAGATASANGGIVPIIGGAQDNGTELYSGNADGWTEYYGGDGGTCAADPVDGNYLYGEYVYLQVQRSTNGGRSAADISSGISDAGSYTTANFIAPFVLDPNDTTGNTMLAGGQSLWRSTNLKAATPTWAAINGSTSTLPTTSIINAVAVAQGDANEILVGFNDGSVYEQTGTVTGASPVPAWTQLGSTTLPSGRAVLSIYVAPNPTATSKTVYVTYGGYSADNIWRGVWNGTTWIWTDLVPAASGFPQVPVFTLEVNPTNSSWLYAGTDVGLFNSIDGGTTWSTSNDGPANVRITHLFWYDTTPGSLQLIATTFGRGMWQTPVSTTSAPADPAPTISGLSPSSVTVNGPSFTLTVNGTGFVNGSVAQWNGVNLTTSVKSGTKLTALVPASDLTTLGTYPVTVVNPVVNGGGGTSASMSITVAKPSSGGGVFGLWSLFGLLMLALGGRRKSRA